MSVKAYATHGPKDHFQPLQIERRTPGANDVEIAIKYCGVCHSDVHQARDEWGGSIFPMVPGHEIVGEVTRVGDAVRKFNVGDKVGVGCLVDSCRVCTPCKSDTQQYCEKGMVLTYNGYEKDGKTPTFGGYSKSIVVDENYVLTIPANLPLDKAAPLLCAGITTYSPLRHWQIQPGDKVGVVGLGGLGHMAVKIAAAMGADVTVFSTSDNKREDALRLGAHDFINTKNPAVFKDHAKQFKFILNTAAGNTDLNQFLELVSLNGSMVLVGVPEKPATLHPIGLILQRRTLAGSLIGGIKETQEMLDFCGKHNITSDIELIPMTYIDEAYDRMVKSDVRYRFVLDIATL